MVREHKYGYISWNGHYWYGNSKKCSCGKKISSVAEMDRHVEKLRNKV